MAAMPSMRLLLVLVLQFAPRNRAPNHAQEPMIPHPISCEVACQATGDGTSESTLPLGGIRVVWALLLTRWQVGILISALLLLLMLWIVRVRGVGLLLLLAVVGLGWVLVLSAVALVWLAVVPVVTLWVGGVVGTELATLLTMLEVLVS